MATASTDDLLKCNICLDRIKSPRALPCLHSFCETCLQQHVQISRNSDGITNAQFPCPMCRRLTSLPKEGIKGFPIDFRINQLNDVLETVSNDQKHCELCTSGALKNLAVKYCLDCKKHFCKHCNVKHQMSNVLKSHSLVDVINYQEVPLCTTHKKEPIKFFCKACNTGICLFCVLGNHEHHLISSFEDVYVVKKDELTDTMNHIDNQISFLNSQIFDITCKEGKIRSKYVEEKLAYKAKHKYCLNGAAEKFLTFSDDSYKAKRHNLMKEKDLCYQYLHQFKMIQMKLESFTRSGNVSVLLDSYSYILQEIQNIDVKSEISRTDLHLNSSEVTNETFKFLPILESRHCSKRESNFSFESLLHRGSNSRQLHFIKGRHSDQASYKSAGATKYNFIGLTAAKTPLDRCINHLSTMVLPRQPYNPAKYRSTSLPKIKLLFKIGGYGHVPGSLNLPFGIAFLENDILVVAENGTGRIQKFDSFGQSLECIQLTSGYPRCVTVGQNNDIFITDEHNKCIKKVSMTTEAIVSQSRNYVQFPYGIVALSDGNLVVSDMIYERLSIIKPSGEMALQFGCHGNTNSTFDNPSYLATDGENILVSDSGHHQVKVFDKNGKFLYKIGNYGSNNGELKYPKGIAITRQGAVIVADSGNNRIVMFSKMGDFAKILLDTNNDIDRPIDVACSLSGHLAVAMPDRHEVFVYKLDPSIQNAEL